MSADILTLVLYISFFCIALAAAAILSAVVSAFIMYGFPESRAAKWLDGVWFDAEETPDEIWNHKADECISGKKWRER